MFKDDRMYVLEISKSRTTPLDFAGNAVGTTSDKWTLVTRKNIEGFPPIRVDDFDTEEEAIKYYKKVVVEMPRVSLGNNSPEVTPSIKEYKEWLIREKLYDELLNPIE
tara:strand:+ start:290 stop:613 length:324 start_codon:yes stop_codon:yes gene_type:complete